jgi:hypothetical protein
MSIDAERLVKVFVKMRDKRAELKRAFEAEDAAIKAKQETDRGGSAGPPEQKQAR